ncbi:MAG: hypothetical protein V3V08_09120 [Nannocystaceae bacterium]
MVTSAQSTTDTPDLDAGPRRPIPEDWLPIGAAVLGFALAMLFRTGSVEFCLDDAWIHLAYADNLRNGYGFSYNPGDWETGSSSPLWVLLLAAWPVSHAPVWQVQLLGALLHGVTAFCGGRLAIDLARQRATVQRPVPLVSLTALAGLLVACWPPLLQGAVSGMEVPLTSAIILGTIVAALESRHVTAACLATLAAWARPEAAVTVAVFGGWLALTRRRVPAAGLVLGPIVGTATWMFWCHTISGYAWPNTRYVKATGGGLDGLRYVRDELLIWEPWLVSLSGVILLALAIHSSWRAGQREVAGLLFAWAATILVVAFSRQLHVGVQFYERRYFLIVSALPLVAMTMTLITRRRVVVALLWLPLGAAIGIQSASLHRATRNQEKDIHRLHRQPALYVRAQLPARAIIGVEGAGAIRYFAPRSMTIIDLVGLNDREIAHAESSRDRVCRLLEKHPTHLVLPDNVVPRLERVFDLRTLQRFEDPAYHQVHPPHPVSVRVFAIDGVKPAWTGRCPI